MKSTFLTFLLLPAVIFLSAQHCDFYYDSFSREFVITWMDPPANPTSEKKSPRWLLFWEFGDGHYAMQEQEEGTLPRMQHEYARPGTYQVKLYVAPLYARAVPEAPLVTKTITADQLGKPDKEYDFEPGQDVTIETNANKEAIPKHTVRVAVSTKSNSGGHLILLYNNAGDVQKLNFSPFNDSQDPEDSPGLYYADFLTKTTWEDLQAKLPGLLSPSDLEFVVDQAVNEFDDKIVFKVANGGNFNAFYSLVVNKSLAAYRYRTESLKISALYVPDDQSFSRKKHLTDYNFKVEDVHDPNRITIEPRVIYYKRGQQQDLIGKIRYKNKGKGVVDTVRIGLTISKDLLAGPEDIVIDTALCEPKVQVYRPGITPESERSVQWRRVESTGKDSLIFVIRNVGLMRKEKGLLVFKIPTHDKRPRDTEIDGGILFTGAPKDIPLSGARPKWRHKGLFLSVGYPLSQNITVNGIETFFDDGESFPNEYEVSADPITENITDNFSLQLTYQNAPMQRGWLAWGYGVGYTRQKFEYSFGEFVRDQTEIQQANIRGLIGVQLQNLLRLSGHASLNFPLIVNRSFINGFVIHSGGNGSPARRYGMLQNREDQHQTSLGFTTGLSVEIGDVHGIVGGARVNYTNFPVLFKNPSVEECFNVNTPNFYCNTLPALEVSTQMTTFELFLKLKLAAFGRKSKK